MFAAACSAVVCSVLIDAVRGFHSQPRVMADELHSPFCEGSILLLVKSVSLPHLGSESNLHLFLLSQLFDIFFIFSFTVPRD